MTRFALILVALAFSSARPAQAEIDYTPLNRAVATEAILPAFARLDETARQQMLLWSAACSQPTEVTVAGLKAAYHRVADAWAGLFHWNLGPITLYLRRDRFYHWPERRNSVGKGMTALLASEEALKLAPERFKKSSVAVQGLPALERLLFTDVDIMQNPWACEIGKAIADNLAAISGE